MINTVSLDLDGCFNLCKFTEKCSWLSFNKLQSECILFELCPEVENIDGFVTNQIDCRFNPLQMCKFIHCQFLCNFALLIAFENLLFTLPITLQDVIN